MNKKDKQLVSSLPRPTEEELFDTDVVASATECTGLIPTPPISEGEAESYTEIYNIPQPEEKINHGYQHE